MNLSSLSVRRGVTFAMTYLIVLGFGLFSLPYFFLRLVLKPGPTGTLLVTVFVFVCLIFAFLGRTRRKPPAAAGGFNHPRVSLGLVAGLALALNTVVAVCIGGAVPLLLKRYDRDPALASGPILTTVTDMFGFFLVLNLATLMLPKLTGG